MGVLYWYWISFGGGFMCCLNDGYSFMVTVEEGGNNNNRMTSMDLFLELTTCDTPKNHKVLEAELCQELHTSGEPALSTATSCTYDFIYSDNKQYG